MTFYKKIAKLGKSSSINCHQVSDSQTMFDVYICDKKVTKKTLKIENKSYLLSAPKTEYVYAEVIGLNDGYILSRIGDSISIIGENNG